MRRTRLFAAIVFITGILAQGMATASDLAKEKRWAEQIVDGLFDGEPLYLEADGQKFLTIYTPAAQPRGAVILLHGIGVHPDWPQVINPLRTQLPARGWTTLSVQLPILPNEAESKDYIPLMKEVPGRMKAAIAELESRGIKNILVVAHSLGATMSTYYLEKSGDPRIKGIAVIGAQAGISVDGMDTAARMGKIRLPMLDLYGSEDLEAVVKSAEAKATAAGKAGNSNYRQVKVSGANHFFERKEKELVDMVSEWLAGLGGK